MVPLAINQHSQRDNELTLSKQQAITWSSVVHDFWRNMASLGHMKMNMRVESKYFYEQYIWSYGNDCYYTSVEMVRGVHYDMLTEVFRSCHLKHVVTK